MENLLNQADQKFVGTPEGFAERYIWNLAYYSTNKQAYEATERQFAGIMGKTRYKDFETFKAAYSRMNKKNAARNVES